MIKFLENEQELYEVARIHTDNIKSTYIGIYDQDYLDSLTYDTYYKFWKREWLRDDIEIILAKENDVIAGFAMIIFSVDETGCGILDRLHVRKDMQHRGIGRSLIAASAGFLWNIGVDSMQIVVIGGNERAEMLYRSLGALYLQSYTREHRNRKILRKKFIWNDLEKIADKSVYRKLDYNYEQIYSVLKADFILFGAGEYCDAFMKSFPDSVPKKIFDNDTKKWGMLKGGVMVEKPKKADNIIIAAGYYSEIEKQLKELGCRNIVQYYPWHHYDQRGML